MSLFHRNATIFATGFVVTALVLSAARSEAQSCSWNGDFTPAKPAPEALWGNLEPTDTNFVASERDNSSFNQIGNFDRFPYWESVDIEEGWVFTVASRTLQVWDARTNPGSPSLSFSKNLTELTKNSVPALQWTPDAHAFLVFKDIDAPAGNSNLFAMVGWNGVGLAIFDSSSKVGTTLIYQDKGPRRYGQQVWATTFGGRSYAFMAAFQGGGGIYAYDMTAASQLTSPCIEATPAAPACPGVYLGRIGAKQYSKYIDGAGTFIASSGGVREGIEIWNVANPRSPVRVINAFDGETLGGIALWRHSGKYYLAVRTLREAAIYNVSCITAGSCSLGSPIWTQAMTATSSSFITYSASNGTPFLYFGLESNCIGGDQNEWLLDVSNPAAPVDISPTHRATVDGRTTTYWGWYYWGNGGVNYQSPRIGKFFGDYFYRAAFSIFDIHRKTGGTAPTANYTYSPALIYPGTAVNFTDTSSSAPTSWDWSFGPDGVPASSTQKNPAGITFGTVGSKTVSLDATNGVGTGTVSKTLSVLSPIPVVASVSASPTAAKVCQPITFTAQGVTGEPPLTFSWQVKDPQSAVVASGGNANPFVWTSVPTDATGVAYAGEVTVTNSSGATTKASAGVLLSALLPLPASDSFAPTYSGAPADPVTGTVAFSVNVAGATEWNWNFGDDPTGGPAGDGYDGWTSNPLAGPAPIQNYDQVGTYEVRVKVRNCLEGEKESSAVSVTINSVEQLIANFAASGLFCSGGTCFADTNQVITFNDSSSGSPETWDYDWDGDGSYEQPGRSTPVTTHAYTTVGTFQPVLRVNRGPAQIVFQHAFRIQVGQSTPPPPPSTPRITVTGASSGTTGQNLSFSATASHCTPNASGWTWTTSGGSFNGSSNGSTVSISWASAGTKTVTARNSGCGSVSGTRAVSINTGGGGGGGGALGANFTFTPANPAVGQAVSFDAGSSTGNPGSFTWRKFGDSSPTRSGRTVSHTYSQAGQYQVTLEVARTNDSSCPPFNICTSEVTKTVTVGGSPPPTEPTITVTGPATGTPDQGLSFNASASGCTANSTGWTWTTSGGTINGATNGSSVSISWSTTGSKAITARNSACGSAVGNRSVTISNGGGGLGASFVFTPANPQPGQTVSFDASGSTGNPGSFTWTSFGDGSSQASGQQTTHTYQRAGQYQVTLEVARNDDPSCPPFNICTAQVSKVVTVGGSPPPPAPEAAFNVDVTCDTIDEEDVCSVEEGQVVHFTDVSTGTVSSRAWDFGDSSTGTTAAIDHSWDTAGPYVVTLTVIGPGGQDSATKTFEVQVELPPEEVDGRILIPWVSKSDGNLIQLSSLYVHNPDSQKRSITMRFYLRRAPSDKTPPQVHLLELEAGATASFPDVLGDPFGLNNVTGFLEFEGEEGAPAPVAVVYNKTFLADGTSFGQVVPAVAIADLPRREGSDKKVLHLVGLNDDANRLGFFGITNPNESVARYRLRFFNSLGEEVGTPPAQLASGPMNIQQNQVERIRSEFDITNLSDYRVEVEVLTKDPVYLYGMNLQLQTLDPSFLRQATESAQRVFLLGVLAAQGINQSLWRTDSLLVNTSDEEVKTEITYTPLGIGAAALPPVTVALQPRETLRLVQVLQDQWGLAGTADLGFLKFRPIQGALPLIQAESYDIANPSGRFGQFIPPFTDDHIAEVGERQILTGLRQDDAFRSTIWLLNTHEKGSGEYTLIVRDSAGLEVGRIPAYRVSPGNMRQLSPGQLPLPQEALKDGFTLEIIVLQGELLSAAQVVDNVTNDPKFVAGQTR